jgi:predicted glycosyltransferase
MFEDLTLDELRDLLQQLRTKQAETERLIREVIDRIDASVPDHANVERRRAPRHQSEP